MKTKRLTLMVIIVCIMVFSLFFLTAFSEGVLSDDLTNYMLFDMVFREASSISATISNFHVFSPLYADGHWVRTYYTDASAYMQVLVTSPGPQGSVVAVNVISDGEESPMYRELCGYAIAALTLSIPSDIEEAINNNTPMDEVAVQMGIESVGYVFSFNDDGTVPYASLKTAKPYDVEQRLDIPKDQSVMYPLPPDTISVKTFVERFERVLEDHYGLSSASMTHIGTIEAEGGDWLHAYVVMDILLSVVTGEEAESAHIKNVNIIDIQGNPPLLVGLGMAAFAALEDFDVEQYAAMSLLSGAHSTFDDFLSFLPTVAYNNMMLLFGISGENGAAYIMGTPK